MNLLLNDCRLCSEIDIKHVCGLLARQNYCFIPAGQMQTYLADEAGAAPADLPAFVDSWNDLPRDQYMGDGGCFRSRRHATLSALPSSDTASLAPHQPHYQSLTYNPLNGGIARHFQPVAPHILQGASMTAILRFGCRIFGRQLPHAHWHIEVHQFRIDAKLAAAGKPTPEGLHRDGVDFVLMLMVKRSNIADGCTHIHDLSGQRVDSFTLHQLFDAALVNDRRVLHEVTPVTALDPDAPASRDVLVVTFRKK